MLKNLVLVAGTVVFVVGCAEMSEDAATEAPEVTVATEASEVQIVVETLEIPAMEEVPAVSGEANTLAISAVRTSGDSLTITIVNDGSDTMGSTETTALLITPPSISNEPVYLTSETTASMNLPFSDAVRVGHLLFLSGQIGNVSVRRNWSPVGSRPRRGRPWRRSKPSWRPMDLLWTG